ncbi:MAG TPA: flagellar hook-basal body complex protein [Steroidobacteraceae bacterium]|nr:flagellar hook-basal body complex protein [Steroidobacteraceae bacterium]
MFDALYIGATGMRGQQMQIDAIAQNVANLSTVGYRRRTVSFAEIAAALSNTNATSADGTTNTSTNGLTLLPMSLQLTGAGAIPSTTISNAAGQLTQTNDPMSLAIDGPGFIEVTRADGSPAFTRAGKLRINDDGMLATNDGSPLAAHIQVPSDAHDLSINAQGAVTAMVGDQQDPVDLGVINLATFSNPSGLKPLGDNLYAATDQSGDPHVNQAGDSGMGILKQGFVESSNVQMSDELVNLMLAQRGFELNSKVIQAADQMLGIVNGLFR